MSPFEFFFSFYGLLLALSVAVVAAGAVKALKTRPWRTIGVLTPLLATFVLMDIATFWSWAWDSMRTLPFSFGLLLVGMAIALIYFFAASFVFPEDNEEWASLDEHYQARKRYVLLGAMTSNTVMIAAAFLLTGTSPLAPAGLAAAVFYVFYVATLSVCLFLRNRWVNALMLGLNIVLFLFVAVATFNVETPALGGGG